ncbi:MAG: helicase-related protein, partial [Kineosporiaceae bacterium]
GGPRLPGPGGVGGVGGSAGQGLPEGFAGSAAGDGRRPTIWPHVESRVLDLVTGHRSTLVFANSRRLSERFTARLNEAWAERLELSGPDGTAGADDAPEPGDPDRAPRPGRFPAEAPGQAGLATPPPVTIARAHHGSVSKEQRAIIEEDLKAGRLPAVVATSSLELGIDMGAIDVVVQVESPPSVAGGLQRIGRAGHQVGAVSRGVIFPKYRGDLVQAAVVTERMLAGAIEAISVPANPLDVLAQQVVAMVAMDDWTVGDVLAAVRRTAPFAGLTRGTLEAVLDMLAGRYPSTDFAELRPRLVWDRLTDTLSARPGAQRLAVTSGGTIPDRGLFGVFLASGDAGRTGRRVGELDEEMVYESRVGDVITLGASSWRIEDITRDQVLVSPAPGQPGRLPFWHGDAPGRPVELGRALGAFLRTVSRADDTAARDRLAAAGLDAWATDNLLAYVQEQREATGRVPDDRTIVVERFRDELGDWRVCVHSPFGSPVHAPWGLAVAARFRERHGVDVQVMHGDDGLVLRLPDVDVSSWGLDPDGAAAPGPDAARDWADLVDLLVLAADDVEDLVTAEVGGSALFASRFRECAARALLLPRRDPGRRQPLWQQRQRAASLLEVAARYPSFPIVLETVREVLQDVFDVPGLTGLMRDIESRTVSVVEVSTPVPSPFARSLMFGYVAQFLYEGDSPLAERRAAALSLDPQLLAELLGRGEGASLRDLLDPEALARTEADLQLLSEERRARDAEGVADALRRLGPLTATQVRARSAAPDEAEDWLLALASARRAIRVRIGGDEAWAAVEDAGRLRDALGTALPVGVADVFTEPVPDPLGDLLSRYARTRGPFTATEAAAAFGLGVAVVTSALQRLAGAGRVAEGEFRPLPSGGATGHREFCDAEVLRVLRRRSLAALRKEVEPVTGQDLARFLPAWQHVAAGPREATGGRLHGVDGVVRAVEQLAGSVLPASAVESLVLPARVTGYSPALLDELTSAGEVVWRGHGALAGDDGWVSLHLADTAALTVAAPDPDAEAPDGLGARVLEVLAGGGAYFFRALADAVSRAGGAAVRDDELATAVWELVWAGLVTNDTLAPLRVLTGGGRAAHRTPRAPRTRTARRGVLGAARYGGAAQSALPARPAMPSRTGPPAMAGRWSLVPVTHPDTTARAAAYAEVLLDRYGVVTRGSVTAEEPVGGFAGVYRVLSGFEDAGRVRRGYFVEHLGAAQFATPGAVDRLRASAGDAAAGTDDRETPLRGLVLAATDPANPYGAALPWPEGAGRPGRKAGALVVLVDGLLALYVERGGRSILSFTADPAVLGAAATALATTVQQGRLGRVTVTKVDGVDVLDTRSPLTDALDGAGFRATPRGLRVT